MPLLRLTTVIDMPQEVNANNVFYLDVDDGQNPSDTELRNISDEYITDLYDTIVSVINSAVVIARVIVYIVNLADGTGTFLGERLIGTPGGAATGMLPHGAALKIDAKVPLRNRASSCYIPGITYAEMASGGLFSAAVVTAGLAFGAAQRATYVSSDTITGTPVYWSQKELTAYPLTGAAITVNDVPDYQRRRKPGVGS